MSKRPKRGRAVRRPIYGNFSCLGPDGRLLFRCDEKKANWYVRKGLAKRLKGKVFRLLFQPGGPGQRREPDLLKGRRNRCAVCGSARLLSRHHVVPSCYRREFPRSKKEHDFHDVLPLCDPCHHEYERHAELAKALIAVTSGIPIVPEGFATVDRAAKAANALLGPNVIPRPRRAVLLGWVRDFLGRKPTRGDLPRVAKARPSSADHARRVVERVMAGGVVDGFVMAWRKHFVGVMRPRFLPPGWRLDRPVGPADDRRGKVLTAAPGRVGCARQTGSMDPRQGDDDARDMDQPRAGSRRHPPQDARDPARRSDPGMGA